MIKAKCVYAGDRYTDVDELTLGKVYDVIDHYDSCGVNTIYIMDDQGHHSSYHLKVLGRVWFVNYTEEYRNEIISDILK